MAVADGSWNLGIGAAIILDLMHLARKSVPLST